jgi:hypothetical protein
MKKIKFYYGCAIFAAFTAMVLSATSCKKTEQTVTPAPPSNEFLTTVLFQCINTNAPYDTTTSLWRDLTPNGSNPPDTSKALLHFRKNASYKCMVFILDESGTPAAQLADTAHFNINTISPSTNNVTTEIRARQNYHLICFTMTPAALNSNLTVTRTDYDNNTPALQVGLDDNVTTLSPTAGRMEVVLHHQPNVKNGSCEPGSIDFDVTYGVTIN